MLHFQYSILDINKFVFDFRHCDNPGTDGLRFIRVERAQKNKVEQENSLKTVQREFSDLNNLISSIEQNQDLLFYSK